MECPSCDGMGATYVDHSSPGVTCEECRGGGVVEAPPVPLGGSWAGTLVLAPSVVEWFGIPVVVVSDWPDGALGVAVDGVVEGYVCKCGRSHILNGDDQTECPCGALHIHNCVVNAESLLADGFVETTCQACINDTATGHTMGAECARIPF